MAAAVVGDKKLAEERDMFTQYVRDICAQQRNHIADRCEKMARHQRRWRHYFFGTQALSISTTIALLWAFGPRNVFSNSSYVFRCLSPAIGIGLCFYGVSWQGKVTFGRFRVWAYIEDCEYELRRVKAHHVPEGASHLAWLEFVLEQIKAGRVTQLDIAKLRQEPKNIC